METLSCCVVLFVSRPSLCSSWEETSSDSSGASRSRDPFECYWCNLPTNEPSNLYWSADRANWEKGGVMPPHPQPPPQTSPSFLFQSSFLISLIVWDSLVSPTSSIKALNLFAPHTKKTQTEVNIKFLFFFLFSLFFLQPLRRNRIIGEVCILLLHCLLFPAKIENYLVHVMNAAAAAAAAQYQSHRLRNNFLTFF